MMTEDELMGVIATEAAEACSQQRMVRSRSNYDPAPIADEAGSGRSGRSLYRTILADPPWKWKPTGDQSARGRQPVKVPYPMMDTADICALPIGDLAAQGAHLWLWTDNGHLRDGFEVMEAWGFRYLAPVTWIKPSGAGMWFVHRTQTLLFGYRRPLSMRERYRANVFEATPGAHSAKPNASYELIEAVSEPARIEIFARPWTPMFPRRDGWDVWGNEVVCSVSLGGGGAEQAGDENRGTNEGKAPNGRVERRGGSTELADE